ncbi:unnamed protein product [Ambrosiozyma monospora]|uniref:Unnamed protein product n=1 Tax=Ambrosiozyma monospora TaxID=43982 RepID=A0ACB5TER9_AMBMO|nr:unnamed protein product [Ambrosiozyma monospora]
MVLLDYLSSNKKLLFNRPLEDLTLVMDYHPLLNDVLVMVIPELEFHPSIFESCHFKEFVSFIERRSIKIKLSELNFLDTENEDVFKLLEYGCSEVRSCCEMFDQSIMSIYQFLTSMTCDVPLLEILFLNSNIEMYYPRLSCLKIKLCNDYLGSLAELEFLDGTNLIETIIYWRRSALRLGDRRLILSFSLEFVVEDDFQISDFFADLMDWNCYEDFEYEFRDLTFKGSSDAPLQLLSQSISQWSSISLPHH